MINKTFTNCFLIKTDSSGKPTHVCLALKKRGWGVGLWNGSGGKPAEGETVDQAAIREVQEELGVTVTKYTKRGEIDFYLRAEDKLVKMHTFLATAWEGEPTESEEMKPEWFAVDSVPYEKMWASDHEWLPLILAGKRLRARYTYAHEGGEVETRVITEVQSFN